MTEKMPTNSEIISTGIEQHTDTNLEKDVLVKNIIEDNSEEIEKITAEINALQAELPVESIPTKPVPDGASFTTNQSEKKSAWPKWVRKITTIAGIASAGLLASHQAQAGGPGKDTKKSVTKTENVKSVAVENLHEINVTEELAWNNFVDFLKQKNLIGDPQLNHIEFSKNLINEFNKTAATPLSWSSIKSIQHAINLIKLQEIDLVKQGKATVEDKKGNKLPVDSLMKHTSPEDGIPGMQTSSYKFPIATEKEVTNQGVTLNVAGTSEKLNFVTDKKTKVSHTLVTPSGDGLVK